MRCTLITEDNCAIDVGDREIRIELDRQIKIDECKGQISAAIRQAAPLSIVFGVLLSGLGNRRSSACDVSCCYGAWHRYPLDDVGKFRLVGDRDLVWLVVFANRCIGW